ncbi:hypothetical protein AB0J81_13630 [Streptomyces bobili]|uniref:hypothetical protein n=1 Tax=Streptomyces bobili TaxID=67280 RepID=UPI003422BB5F
MSDARRALIDLLHGERPAALEAAYGPGEHPEREKDADAILVLHAHELAEKIRALGITEWEGMNESVRMLRKMRAQAADLIDPKKEGQ